MLARFYSLSGDAQATARCVVPARILPGQVCVATRDPLQKGPVSVWQNPVSQHLFELVADKELGNRIIVDVDDPYLTMSEGWKQRDVESHLDAIKMADVVICATEPLADLYGEIHDDVRVIPSCVALEDFQFGRQMQHLDGKLRIGYAAGYSHAADAKLVADALAQISEHPDVIVEFVGAFDPGWEFDYKRYPALPYAGYKAMIATWNIGLAPLAENPLNSTRSDLKALDYAMSFAVGVCSPYGPYAELVEQGLVASAESTQEWYEALLELVENQMLCQQIAMNAYTYCLIERNPANQRVRYLDAMDLRRRYIRV